MDLIIIVSGIQILNVGAQSVICQNVLFQRSKNIRTNIRYGIDGKRLLILI